MAEARRSSEWIAVLAFDGYYTRRSQARSCHWLFPLAIADDSAQSNILIDRDSHPRLTDYGLNSIMSDPKIVGYGIMTPPSVGTIRYAAPELLSPSGCGLGDGNPTKESDDYAFGMVTYEVNPYFVPGTATEGSFKVTTGLQPFPGAKDGAIMCNIVDGERPVRPSFPNEWVSDNVWSFISRCWGPSWDRRPDVDCVVNVLNDAADSIEARRREAPNWGKGTQRPTPGMPHKCQMPAMSRG